MPYRPHLVSATTRPTVRPLVQHVFGDFNPLDLDPYLLFDAESSMRGTLEAPTLDLDPATPSSLDVITAVRAGVATYTDASGLIQSATANTVRVDHVDGVPMILVEPSSENLVTYSEDFSEWADDKVVLTTGFSSPDGLSNATKITPTTASGAHLLALVAGASVVKTYSVFAKADGYNNFRINTGSSSLGYASFDVQAGTIIITGGSSHSASSIENVGNGWFKCSISFSAGAGTNMTLAVENSAGSVSFEGDGNNGIQFWGAQAEAGSVATSYIPTSGSTVTRAADNLDISGSAFTNFFNSGGDGTFYAEFTKRDILSDQAYILAGHSGSQRYFYLNAQQAYLASYDGAGPFIAYGNTQTTLNRASVSYNATHKEGSLNGSTVSTVTSTGDLRDSTRLAIGQSWTAASQMNGHIKRLIYWPTHSDSL